MSIVNQIQKDGINHEIGAIYDDSENKISEFYATKEELTSLQNTITELQSSIEAINEKLATLEAYHASESDA